MRGLGPFGRRILLVVLLAFLAALAGVFIGRAISEKTSEQASALHDLLHEDLDLTAEQRQRIDQLEGQFAVRRRALELEIRADNARLAAAIQAEHGYGPRVDAEVERSHRVMGNLQKETLAHIFAMRGVLRPDQQERFDQAVVRTLTAGSE